MAKIYIGNVDMEIQAPAKPEPAVSAEQPSIDVMSLLEKAVALMPKPEVISPEKVDLKPLIARIEATEEAVLIDMMAIDKQLEDMKDRLERAEAKAHPAPRLVEIPEVKQITHVKDVSAEVRLELLAHIEKNKTDIRLDINDMKTELKKSRSLNIVLGLVLTLTLLAQLI